MKGKTLFLMVLMTAAAALSARSQTTSMDFTRTDCDGIEHHLYQELDEGKVVVLEYIMLGCSSCIIATEEVKKVIEPFETSNPGRVKQYIFGFIKNYTCTQLEAWQEEYNLRGTMFEDGSSQVGYYGGMGMPTIVVTATNTHQVLFRKVGFEMSDTTEIRNAIMAGLQYNPQAIGDDLRAKGIRIYPTVFTDRLHVTLPAPMSGKMQIFDLSGREVAVMEFGNTSSFEATGLSLRSGLYFVVLAGSEGIIGSMKLIRQ